MRAAAFLTALLLADPAAAGGGAAWEGFSAVDLDGRRWDAGALAGKVVLLDFWATWCAPCRAELPHLKRAYERHRGAGFEILGVSLDQGPKREVRSWLWRQEVEWPQLHDGRGMASPLARRFGVDRVPRTVLVDRNGRVLAVDLRGAALERALAAVLEPPPQ